MRTDGEIERLSEMPADSINLPPGKRGTSARPAVAARRLGYINHATGRKRAWQLLARLRHSKTADTQFLQHFREYCEVRLLFRIGSHGGEDADERHPLALLRARYHRPRRRAAEQCDELAPVHS